MSFFASEHDFHSLNKKKDELILTEIEQIYNTYMLYQILLFLLT